MLRSPTQRLSLIGDRANRRIRDVSAGSTLSCVEPRIRHVGSDLSMEDFSSPLFVREVA